MFCQAFSKLFFPVYNSVIVHVAHATYFVLLEDIAMNSAATHWDQLYRNIPLCDIPFHFANIGNSSYLLQYLMHTLALAPPGSSALETGIGSGLEAVWLSLRGVQAEGLDNAPGIVERARQVNNILGGSAAFRLGDLFSFYLITS